MWNLLPLAVDDSNPVNISLTVLLTGLIVVFLVLICLTFIIYLYGNIVHKTISEKKHAESPKITPSVPAPSAKPAPAPIVEDGISAEIVAAIAAAVYCTEGVSVSSIKSIKRSRPSTRSAWGMAGLIENTKPF